MKVILSIILLMVFSISLLHTAHAQNYSLNPEPVIGENLIIIQEDTTLVGKLTISNEQVLQINEGIILSLAPRDAIIDNFGTIENSGIIQIGKINEGFNEFDSPVDEWKDNEQIIEDVFPEISESELNNFKILKNNGTIHNFETQPDENSELTFGEWLEKFQNKFTNQGIIENEGKINNTERFENSGDFYNTGSFSSGGHRIQGTAEFSNTGTIKNENRFALGYHMELILGGNIENNGDLGGEQLVNIKGNLTNNGSISTDQGYVEIEESGHFENNKDVELRYGHLENRGNFENNGKVSTGMGGISNTGVVKNNGDIILRTEWAELSNDGIFENNGKFIITYREQLEQNKPIINNGIIIGNGELSPKQQMELVSTPYSIICKEDFVALVSIDESRAICVTESSSEKLITRGWFKSN